VSLPRWERSAAGTGTKSTQVEGFPRFLYGRSLVTWATKLPADNGDPVKPNLAATMSSPIRLATGAVVTAAVLLTAVPATAQPIDRGQFVDSFDSGVYTCEGTPARDVGSVHVNFLLNQRGSSPFPYSRESVHGSVTTTNLVTGGTFTNFFSTNTRDHTITDNGDGTITITDYGQGGSRFYDQFGKLVLKDPGTVRFAFDIDYHGTPGNVEDDTDVPDSFRIVRASTGNSDFSDRDFCADLVEFTSP
jgi:hypothetical protein